MPVAGADPAAAFAGLACAAAARPVEVHASPAMREPLEPLT